MKFLVSAALLFLSTALSLALDSKAGFFLPENVSEVTFKFQTVQNLIVLPVTINDTIRVNLILDTGCRNLVLFGKKFQKLFSTEHGQSVQFAGLGSGKPVNGKLSLNNKVSIHAVIGEQIPVVVVPHQNLFSAYQNIHGVIGYDILIKFEIELNSHQKLITFRPAAQATLSPGYQKVPLLIIDSRPLIRSTIFIGSNGGQLCDLMLDTGSTLALLIKTTDVKKFPKFEDKKVLGKGLNGVITGIEAEAELIFETIKISNISAGIIHSAWHNYASVGMDVMKNYSVVLNYCRAYAGFKKNTFKP
jgi:hypothetical protein